MDRVDEDLGTFGIKGRWKIAWSHGGSSSMAVVPKMTGTEF